MYIIIFVYKQSKFMCIYMYMLYLYKYFMHKYIYLFILNVVI